MFDWVLKYASAPYFASPQKFYEHLWKAFMIFFWVLQSDANRVGAKLFLFVDQVRAMEEGFRVAFLTLS